MKDPFSLDEPIKARARKVKLTEGKIQEKCVAYARARGYWARKFSSPSQRSVPDYIFGKASCTVFVEFKNTGKKPMDKQLDEHKVMAAAGLMVHVIDDVLAFKGLLIDIEKQIDELEKKYS